MIYYEEEEEEDLARNNIMHIIYANDTKTKTKTKYEYFFCMNANS
jgi:hypothetical protein